MATKDLNDALERAVFYEKDLQKVKQLISAGAEVQMEAHKRSYGSYEGGTLLHRCSDAAIVRELVSKGVPVDRLNRYRETPLHLACCGGPSDVVKELLEAGAWVNARDRKGNTPLNKAVKNICRETIKVLLEYGADINIRNRETRLYDNHNSPLENAIGELSVAKLLIKMFLIKNFENNRHKIDLEPYTECSNYDNLVRYFDDCVSEIVQMKTEMVNQLISLYDLMTKVAIDLSDNNEWVKKIKGTMIERYPIYHDIIGNKIEFCTTRWRLLNELSELKLYTELETLKKKQTILLDPGSVHVIARYLCL